jgi:hypothetical protein
MSFEWLARKVRFEKFMDKRNPLQIPALFTSCVNKI